MKTIYYITISLLFLCIVRNTYFVFHLDLYKSTYGIVLQVLTFISLIIFLAIAIIQKRNLTKELNEHYETFFSKN